jgi:hypothetical protein
MLPAVLFVALGQSAGAQSGRGGGQGGLYDPATEVKVSGRVSGVENVTPPGGPGRMGAGGGLHLTLATGSDSVVAHLGPAAFLKEQAFDVAVGDDVEILGSRVQLDGKPVLLAREVKKGGRTVTLRDASGRPLWSGTRRR